MSIEMRTRCLYNCTRILAWSSCMGKVNLQRRLQIRTSIYPILYLWEYKLSNGLAVLTGITYCNWNCWRWTWTFVESSDMFCCAWKGHVWNSRAFNVSSTLLEPLLCFIWFKSNQPTSKSSKQCIRGPAQDIIPQVNFCRFALCRSLSSSCISLSCALHPNGRKLSRSCWSAWWCPFDLNPLLSFEVGDQYTNCQRMGSNHDPVIDWEVWIVWEPYFGWSLVPLFCTLSSLHFFLARDHLGPSR